MLSIRCLLFIWTFLATVGAATDVNLAELVTSIPNCALDCILSGLSQSPDIVSHPERTCSNVTLQAALSICVQGKCNLTEQTQLATVYQQLCKAVPIDDSRVWAVTIVGLVCCPLALLAIALRIYSRYSIAKKVGPDDWLISLAGAALCVLIGLVIENSFVNGFGRHLWNINLHRVVPLLKIFYVGEVLYILVITLVKASILMFYLRVFPSRSFRTANLLVLGLVIASGVGVTIPVIFQCTPVSGAWDLYIEKKCIKLNVLAYATGGMGVGLDIVILALPVPELLHLNMNRRKKIHVLFMFSLGSVACITSIVRLKYLVAFATSKDPIWDNAIPALWSLLEICVAIICSCLPAMRVLFTCWLPCIFDIDSTIYNKFSSGRNQNSCADQNRSGGEKTGPSYNKRPIETPDQELLDHIGNKGGRTETRVWVNPKFDEHGNVLITEVSGTKCHDAPSSNTSVFALEGPRDSDDDPGIIEEGLGIAMQNFRNVTAQTGNQVLIETSTTQTISAPETFKNLSSTTDS